MLSPFCRMIPCRIGTNFPIPVIGYTTQRKLVVARKSIDWVSNGAGCAFVHLFSVLGSRHGHPLHLHLHKPLSILDFNIILGLRVASSKSFRSRPLATKKVNFETGSEEATSEESNNANSKCCWIALPAVALSLSAVLGSQPAYAEFRTNMLPEVDVQMEVAVDGTSSVEAILAKQLARRFRDMTDEELVDILQQILNASKSSSFSPQNAVDDGIFPQDSALQKEKSQIGTETAERTRDEKIHATDEVNTNSSTEDKDEDIVSETQRRKVQGVKETRERNGGEPTRFQAKSRQVDETETQKLSEEANYQEQQSKGLSTGKGNDESISNDARNSETQERLRGGGSAPTIPQNIEKNEGDGSVRSKSESADLAGASAADESVRGGSRQDEDVTELLWAEWSRRVGGEIVGKPESSSTSFNLAESGQDLIKRVAALTPLQKTISVFTIWCFFMVLAYRLGSVRASSRTDTTRKKAPIDKRGIRDLSISSSDRRAMGDVDLGPAILSEGFDFFQDSVNARISGLTELASKGKRVLSASDMKDSYEAGVSVGEEQSSRKRDSPENGKWSRTFLRDELLAETQETSDRNQVSIQVPSQFVPGASRQDLSYISNPSKNGTRGESPNAVGSRFDMNAPINSEINHLEVHHGGEETSRGLRTIQNPSRVPLRSQDSNGTLLEAADSHSGQGGSQSSLKPEWSNPDLREIGEQRGQEELSTSDGIYVSPIVDSWKVRSVNQRRVTSPTDDLYSAGTRDTGRVTLSRQSLNPQKPVDDDLLKGPSRKFDYFEKVKQEHSPEAVNANQRAGEVEGSVASQSEAKLDSFLHDQFLWVRDDDGIFIRQPAAIEEGGGGNVTSLLRGQEQDMSHSTRSFDSARNGKKVEGRSLLALDVPIERRKRSARGFDYRQLVINSEDEFTPVDQKGFAAEKEAEALRPQMLPLRYGSGRQKVP